MAGDQDLLVQFGRAFIAVAAGLNNQAAPVAADFLIRHPERRMLESRYPGSAILSSGEFGISHGGRCCSNQAI